MLSFKTTLGWCGNRVVTLWTTNPEVVGSIPASPSPRTCYANLRVVSPLLKIIEWKIVNLSYAA